MSDFQKDTKVTIYSDKEGKHPRRIGFVKRIGNGAWRLGGCSEWYDFDGKRVAVDVSGKFAEYAVTTHFARLYQEGDEAAIALEDERVKKYKALVSGKGTLEWRIQQERGNCQYALQCAERSISSSRERLGEAERLLNYTKGNLEQALANRAKAVVDNTKRAKTIEEDQAKLALIEAELARFGMEW